MIDVPEEDRRKGDSRFRRFEYWGMGSYFLLHYVGDSSVFVSFRHRSCKVATKPFVTSAPHVKKKGNQHLSYEYTFTAIIQPVVQQLSLISLQILSKDLLMAPQKVYQEVLNDDEGNYTELLNNLSTGNANFGLGRMALSWCGTRQSFCHLGVGQG